VKASSGFVDFGMKSMNALHRALWAVSGGRLLKSAGGMPVVELHTTGRKSGQERTVILTSPVQPEEGIYVLVASKGGDDRNPDWYRNLVAEPDIALTVDGERRPMRARTATAEEKVALWPQVVAAYKGYAGYQKRTERDIPLVICEPRS
jgi:deazaflavin-dependent oxidoreductase (nitroreductase family)